VIVCSIFTNLKEGTLQRAEIQTNCCGCVRACVHKDKTRKAKARNERPNRKKQTLAGKMCSTIQLALRKELSFCSGQKES